MPAYLLGDRVFRTKTAARDAFRAVLVRAVDDQPLQGEDDELVRLLIHEGNHPEADDKIGPGIAAVLVRRSSYGTRGFWLRRVDDSEIDFSYLTALDGAPTPERAVKAALRQEIADQVAAFRETVAAAGPSPCGLCPEKVAAPAAHVDHADPTFEELASRFAAVLGGWDRLAVECFGSHGRRLADRSLGAVWQEFHRHTARLRLTHRRCNLTRPRKESTVLDPTDHALALTVECPKTACAAFCGEPCRLYATQQPTEPHPQRLAAAKAEQGGDSR